MCIMSEVTFQNVRNDKVVMAFFFFFNILRISVLSLLSMEVLIHTFIQTKATRGKRTCPRFETASVGLNPGPLDLETWARIHESVITRYDRS